jgi:uncharacterized membrane-anchored protein
VQGSGIGSSARCAGAGRAPDDAKPLGHFLRGQVALTQNDVPTAVKEFEKAIADDPSTPWLRLRSHSSTYGRGARRRAPAGPSR